MTSLTSCNPLAFYSLSELSLRRASEVDDSAPALAWGYSALHLTDMMVGKGHPQLLASWRHYKAYASAFASWIKVYITLLPTAPRSDALSGVDRTAAGGRGSASPLSVLPAAAQASLSGESSSGSGGGRTGGGGGRVGRGYGDQWFN